MIQPCGLLFVFSGPSAAGKNAIMNALKEREPLLQQLPTATTRTIRESEQPGREHEFLTEAEFRQRLLEKSLIEWQIIHDKGVYGVPRQTIQMAIQNGKPLIADIDVLGAQRLKAEFGDYVVLIFVKTPDKETLARRLRERADVTSEDDLQTRLRRSDFELSFVTHYDRVIVNYDNQLEESVGTAREIILEECQKARLSSAPIGWKPEDIHQWVTVVAIHEGCVLYYDGDFPTWQVPQDQLPFESIQQRMVELLGTGAIPTRLDAGERHVSIDFEPPQSVKIHQKEHEIHQYMRYIVRLHNPPVDFPVGWTLHPPHTLSLDDELKVILSEINLAEGAPS